MILRDKYKPHSTRTKDRNIATPDFAAAEGALWGALAGALSWFLAFVVIGAIVVGW